MENGRTPCSSATGADGTRETATAAVGVLANDCPDDPTCACARESRGAWGGSLSGRPYLDHAEVHGAETWLAHDSYQAIQIHAQRCEVGLETGSSLHRWQHCAAEAAVRELATPNA